MLEPDPRSVLWLVTRQMPLAQRRTKKVSRMSPVKAICVFCGSRIGQPEHAKLAEKMGRIMAEHGVELVYGGGRIGLMGIIADQVKSLGGKVTGIIPEHLSEIEVAYKDADILHVVEDMQARKRMMFDLSDAFVALPGGLGTLDEILDVVTMAQLGMHHKPLVMLNPGGYWDPFFSVVDHMIAAGFVEKTAQDLIVTVDEIEQVLPTLNGWKPPASLH